MNNEERFITMVLQSWETHVARAGNLLNELQDEQLLREIAPGKNRGIYLIGHLIAVHDAMNAILEIGGRSYSELDDAFINHPDKSGRKMPSIDELRSYWEQVHAKLNNALRQIPAITWFEKHAAVSAEDFALRPERNKLNVIINRTNHFAYHLGQLQLLK
ncbi:MAG: DinB family protein [Bacteroidota bacterium]